MTDDQQRPAKGEVRQYTVAEDDDGIRLGMAFLTDIFGVDLAALEAEPGDG